MLRTKGIASCRTSFEMCRVTLHVDRFFLNLAKQVHFDLCRTLSSCWMIQRMESGRKGVEKNFFCYRENLGVVDDFRCNKFENFYFRCIFNFHLSLVHPMLPVSSCDNSVLLFNSYRLPFRWPYPGSRDVERYFMPKRVFRGNFKCLSSCAWWRRSLSWRYFITGTEWECENIQFLLLI